jgi:hypothetical protein
LDRDAPDDDGNKNRGFNFLHDEEEDDNNNDSNDDSTPLLPHRIESRCPEASDDKESDGNNDSMNAMQLTVYSKRMSLTLQFMTRMMRVVSMALRLKTLKTQMKMATLPGRKGGTAHLQLFINGELNVFYLIVYSINYSMFS